MKSPLPYLLALLLALSPLSAEDYRPELFASLKPVYQDDFSSGTLDTSH